MDAMNGSWPGGPRPNWELSPGHEVVAHAIFLVMAVAGVAYCVQRARKERSVFPMFVLLGAGVTVFYEPINNILGHCTYPEISQITWIETLNRKIPTYVGLIYFFYLAPPILWLMDRIRAGLTARQWWKYYSIAVVICTLFEFLPIHYGWWKYYGDNQGGLKVLNFPMFWWFMNPMCLFAMATLFHFARKHLITDRLSPLLVVLWPMAVFSTHSSSAIPIYTALNTTSNNVVTTLASAFTISLCLMVVTLCGKLVTVADPHDTGATTPLTASPVRDTEMALQPQS